ncbi:MAG: dihydrodipicolinate synthase family protein [Bryobacterales bacterium]|nr:dihydrodipicolinate synthase family protein [Bryobacterales bacterium]
MSTRRLFLRLLAAAASEGKLRAGGAKPMAGVFPIVQTPFTNDDKLDTKTLAAEIRFLDRAGVQGVVWPQLASEFFDLTMEERFAGMEVVAAAGKPLKPAVVLGVQADDTAAALKYVKHAEKLAPDAIIALPPRAWKDRNRILEYYKAISAATSRPLIAQTIGDMSVDFVIRMLGEATNLHFVKDEAGETLPRISEFHKRGDPRMRGVFTGGHGKTMIDEMMRGSAGTMPAVPFADLYVLVWDAWRAGDRHKALDYFSKVSLMVTEATAYGLPGIKYMLRLRGVFENTKCRATSRNASFDEQAKRSIEQAFEYVKPLFRA